MVLKTSFFSSKITPLRKSHGRLRLSGLESRQTHGFLQHWLFRSQSLVQTEACTQMGSRNCSGMGDSSSGSPEGLRFIPLLCGWKLFFGAALSERGGACHFGPLQSLPWPLGHVRLIRFLGLVCAALLFFSTC